MAGVSGIESNVPVKVVDCTGERKEMFSLFESIGGPPPRSVPQVFLTTDDGETRHIEFNSIVKELARLKE